MTEAVGSFREHEACLTQVVRVEQHQGRRPAGGGPPHGVQAGRFTGVPSSTGSMDRSPTGSGRRGSDNRRTTVPCAVGQAPGCACSAASGGSIVSPRPNARTRKPTEMPGVEQSPHARPRREVLGRVGGRVLPQPIQQLTQTKPSEHPRRVVETEALEADQVCRALQGADVDVGRMS